MRKIIFLFSVLITITSQAQIVDYSGFGVLLSSDNLQGTARNMALKNSFGALGGDLSAMHTNPASGAIFTQGNAAFTLGYEQKDVMSDFYGNIHNNSTESFNFSQAGGVMIFDNSNELDGIQKISIGINYQIANNFKNDWMASGISLPTWEQDPNDDSILYSNVENQTYRNSVTGKLSTLNFSIAAQYNKDLFIGASINTYDVVYNELATREEFANDGNGNTIDAFEKFWLESTGEGISIGMGLIYKASHNFRFGLSYTSPVWYTIYEDSNMYAENDDDDVIGSYEILYSNDPPAYSNSFSKVLSYEYNLRTPSKLTGSFAFVFNKAGLISADITRKNYQGINFSPNIDFTSENNYIDTNFNDTFKINLGTEWRIDAVSIRGGYSYEQSPYKDAIDSDNLTGYALGIGYNFEKFSIDVAYDYTEQTDYFNFYSDIGGINAANLSKNNDKFLLTLRFGL